MKVLKFVFFTFAVFSAVQLASKQAYAACTNPAGQVGEIIYNETHGKLQGCMADDTWQAFHSETDVYVPNAVEFDGTNDYLRKSSALIGPTDSKQVTASLWLRTPSTSWMIMSERYLDIVRDTVGRMTFTAKNSSSSNILVISSTNSSVTTNEWHHVLVSFDLSDTGRRHIYIDDASSIGTVTTYIDDFIEADVPSLAIMALQNGAGKFNGQVADFWMEFGTYIDFSVEANRRKFIDANGNPVFLGADGSLPTGSAPDIFLSGDTDSWHTNKGTGGGFTENGALTTASTSPGGGCSDPVGTTGEIIYNSDEDVFQGCTAGGWFALHKAGSSGGGCSSPAGTTGEIIYNESEDVYQGCTANGWFAFHPSSNSDPCETGLIGTRCTSDGAIYAGDTVGGARMYAAACDHGMSWDGSTCTGSQTLLQWKTSTATTAGTTSLTDGLANTDAMDTAGIALHPAAEACRNVGAEWYLPARAELDLLYDSLVGQGDTTPGGPLGSTFDFNITGSDSAGWYWSSSEYGTHGRFLRFSDGGQFSSVKTLDRAVRCVRKD